MKSKTIDKIYVCKKRGSATTISKVLVQLTDGNYIYFKLPSFYDHLPAKSKIKQSKKLEKEFEVYLKRFLKENKLSKGDFKNNDLIIFKEGSQLEIYIDTIVEENVEQMKKFYKKNIGLLYDEYRSLLYLGADTEFSLAGLLCNNRFVTLFFSIPSIFCASKSILFNNRREKIASESAISKKIKLYLSYFMIVFNLSLNFIGFHKDADTQNNNIEFTFDTIYTIDDLVNICSQFLYHELVLDDLENPFTGLEDGSLSNSEKVELLMKSINLNPSFSEDDYEILLPLEEFMLENPYFDYEYAYDNLINMKKVNSKIDKDTLAGSYDPALNLITIYDSNNITKEEYMDHMQHETIHGMFGYLDNIVLVEGMTALIQAEYCNINASLEHCAYYDHVWLTRIFCELISPEKMLEAYSKHDMSIIKEEMLKLNSNEEEYEELMSVMQEFGEKFRDTVIYSTFSEEYSYLLYENVTLSQIFSELLKPYINSKLVSDEARMYCEKYLECIGNGYNWVFPKEYFDKNNYENDLDGLTFKQLQKSYKK